MVCAMERLSAAGMSFVAVLDSHRCRRVRFVEMRTISRERVIEEFERIKKTPKYRKILRFRPKLPIEDFWPN
jgi:hypothetical protein